MNNVAMDIMVRSVPLVITVEHIFATWLAISLCIITLVPRGCARIAFERMGAGAVVDSLCR